MELETPKPRKEKQKLKTPSDQRLTERDLQKKPQQELISKVEYFQKSMKRAPMKLCCT